MGLSQIYEIFCKIISFRFATHFVFFSKKIPPTCSYWWTWLKTVSWQKIFFVKTPFPYSKGAKKTLKGAVIRLVSSGASELSGPLHFLVPRRRRDWT